MTLRAMKPAFPRWLLPAAVLLALLVLAVAGSSQPVSTSGAAAPPPPVYADKGAGIWTATRKRAARRRCTERFADSAGRRRCLMTIPNDGDWGAMDRERR